MTAVMVLRSQMWPGGVFQMRLAGSQPAALKGVVTAAAVRVGLGLGDEVSREEKEGFLDRDSRRHARSSPTSSCVLQGHVSPSFAWNSLCVHAVVRRFYLVTVTASIVD